MEHLISAFLMQRKQCTLPQVGTLRIKPGYSRVLTADKMIAGPVPEIQFDKEDDHRFDGLVDFIALEKGVSHDQASTELGAFCSSVQQLFGSSEIVLPGTGKFRADSEGILNFIQEPLPDSYFPAVPAIRVVHPGASHTMRVGDNEISSKKMPEIIRGASRSRRYTWWAAALFILLLSAGLVYYYMAVTGPSGTFGNNRKTNPSGEPVLYRTP